MNEVYIYNAIRSEIVTNHILMHVMTIVVVIILLAGTGFVEHRSSVLSVLLPLLSLSWAAGIVRFDYFIQRQGAYLRAVESHLQALGVSIPLWETWKTSLRSTRIVVPVADLIGVLVIVALTLYLLFAPAQEYFALKAWRGGRIYSWTVTVVLALLLGCLLFIPTIATK